MKKLLSLAAALFCTLPMLAGPGTDTFNCDNLGIAAMDTKSGSWTGQTGGLYRHP